MIGSPSSRCSAPKPSVLGRWPLSVVLCVLLTLRELQLKFFQAITSPPSAGGGYGFAPDFVQLVQGRGVLGAEEHIDIYAHMYCARILDALSEDFPRVAVAFLRPVFLIRLLVFRYNRGNNSEPLG
jgi:hypothetical protein